MWNPDEYELIDFGNGRKLERFSTILLSRLSPASIGLRPQNLSLWEEAMADFGSSGQWRTESELPSEWSVGYQGIRFQIKLSSSGNLGLFPEQYQHWNWLAERISSAIETPRCLNLFAYTGGSSMMMAKAGGHVTHIDSSTPAVKWARQNALDSTLGSGTIRWIVEDASKFVERERKRGNRYDLIVLDPPTYGHGASGESWKLHRDLPRLLENASSLLTDKPLGMLLTGHSEDAEPAEWLYEAIRKSGPLGNSVRFPQVESGRSTLLSRHQKKLDCGYFARIAF